MKRLAGSWGSREARSLEESRAPDPSLGTVLVPTASPSDSWREAESPPSSLAPTILLGSRKGPVGEKTVRLQF